MHLLERLVQGPWGEAAVERLPPPWGASESTQGLGGSWFW